MVPLPPPRPSARPAGARPPASPAEDPPADVTIQDVDLRYADFVDYARHVLGHSAATLHGYRDAYRNFRRFLTEGARPLSEKLYAIEAWVAWNRRRTSARGTPLGAVTLNTYWRQLRSFFTDLERRDGLPSPFRGLKPPTLPTRIPKAWAPKDCLAILATAENIPWPNAYERARAVAIYATILYAGLRRGELLRLQFTDVDVETGTIRIAAGKGTGGGKDRTAYMNRELRGILLRYLAERRRKRIEGPGFFASSRTGRPISEAVLRRLHLRVRRAAGIAFSLHSLRHSFVTMMLAQGVPIHVAQELAGHTKITTTAGYLRVFDEDKRREIEKVSYRGSPGFGRHRLL